VGGGNVQESLPQIRLAELYLESGPRLGRHGFDDGLRYEIELGIGKYDVVLNLDGQVNVSVGGQDYGLEKGQAALLSSLESKVIVKGHAVVARSV